MTLDGPWLGHNDTEAWAEHAGDTDYNIKNKCCRQLNGGSWGQLTYSTSAQVRKAPSWPRSWANFSLV